MTTMGKRAQRRRAEREKQRVRPLPDMRSAERVTASVATALEGGDRTSLDAAQDLIYEAFESNGPKRMELARRALAISADCADAYTILAEETARTLNEQPDRYATFEQDVGDFWGLVETRPYMGLLHFPWVNAAAS